MSFFRIEHLADEALIVRSKDIPGLIRESIKGIYFLQTERKTYHSLSIKECIMAGKKLKTEIKYDIVDILNHFLTIASLNNALLCDLKFCKWNDLEKNICYEGKLFLVNYSEIDELKVEIKAVTYSGLTFIKKGFFYELKFLCDV